MKTKIELILLFSLLLVFAISQATADQLVFDDLIVTGSLCAGADCADEEPFDFDTLKLKADNPQIRFQDTSNTVGFPSNDWAMGITGDAGNSHFYITDLNNDKTILQLSASASGGVALGADAEFEDNVVSVGSAGAERRITHVAEGIDPTDAVNVAQFEQFQTDIEADIDEQMTALETQMTNILISIDDLAARLDNLENP
jgi:hypothetical protein